MKKLYKLAAIAMAALLVGVSAEAQVKRSAIDKRVEFNRVKSNNKGMLDKALAEKQAEQQRATVQQSSRYDLPFSVGARALEAAQRKAQSAIPLRDPSVNSYGIITAADEGETKYYNRSGYSIGYNEELKKQVASEESGTTEVVYSADNVVYILNPISSWAAGSWVKGTIQDGVITVPAKQPIYYAEKFGATISLRWGKFNGEKFVAADDHADSFTFKVEDGKLSLQGTSADGFVMGAIYDDDDYFAAGAYSSVLTEFTPEPRSTELVTLPAGYTAAPWAAQLVDIKEAASTRLVNVAFGKLDVYVQGLFESIPEAWIRGIKVGNNYVFSEYQYLGKYEDMDTWATGMNEQEEFESMKFTFDESNKTLTSSNLIVANCEQYKLYYAELYTSVVLTEYKPREYAVPFIDSLNNKLDFTSYTIIDANGDKSTWSHTGDAVRYRYSSKSAADDWCILPAVKLEGGKRYNFVLDTKSYSSNYPELLEVKIGKAATAEAMQTTLVETMTVASGDWIHVETGNFTVTETGEYYIGLHALSEMDMFYLYVDNIGILEGIEGIVPAALSNVKVAADATGLKKATLTFDVPATQGTGEALTGSVNVIVTVDSINVDTLQFAPGTKGAEHTVAIDSIGYHTFVVTPYVEEGKNGVSTSLRAWVGVDVPNDVASLNIATLDGALSFTWNKADSVGQNGGVVKPDQVKYNLYTAVEDEFLGFTFYDLGTKLTEEPVADTTCVLTYPTFEGEQGYMHFGVTALNEAGESDGTFGVALVGKPYTLPMREDFESEEGLAYFWSVDTGDAAKVGIIKEDDSYACTFLTEEDDYAILTSGMIALGDATAPTLSVDFKGATPLTLFATTAEGDIINLGKTATSDEFANNRFSLAELPKTAWIQISLGAQLTAGDTIYFDNVTVLNLVDNDLTVSLDAPATLAAGKKADVVISVTSLGAKAASGYTVALYADDVKIDEYSADDTDEIEFYKTAEYVSHISTSVFDPAGEITLRAEVTYTGDIDLSNNTDESAITVTAPTGAPVNTIAATALDGGNIRINWTVNEASPSLITEDFESYDMQIVTDGNSMGPWLGYDKDGGKTYGWESASITWPYSGESFAFGLLNPTEAGMTNDGLTNGEQAAVFISNGDAANDDWLVSPLLSGEAQTISFYVSEITADYGSEKFEVLYSTTDQQLTSFQKVYSGEAETTSLTKVEVALPAGALYFAIHYISNDVFVFIVDDITFTGMSAAKPIGYNVYVNQTLVASLEAGVTNYTYKGGLQDGSYDVSVTAIYADGESMPLSTSVELAGIEQLSVEPGAARIFNLQGMRVKSSDALRRGIYVVEGSKAAIR
ncbi:MAG: choice-of-anchor J domain-containing protein [Bacteroidales bacterium]|nr:choice-of-anchor J domain-containing protein [Bacteroidales bacterium]